jgi:molybdate transport system substrate-binding protein
VAKLKVMCARSMHDVVNVLAEDFTRRTGHDTDISYDPVGTLQKRLDAGETADVLILNTAAVDKLAQAGVIDPATRTPIATTSVGIAVREGGGNTPDMSTLEAFRSALLNARAIALSDPARGGSAGVYLAKLFADMGIADEVARKTLPQHTGGEVAARVAEGKADFGMTLIAEIVPVKGARVLGRLPPPLGNDTAYAGGVTVKSAMAEAGRAFLAALKTPAARGRWEAAGFTLPD